MVAYEIAERARPGNSKGRRVEDRAIFVDERVDSGQQIRPAHVARVAAARGVDYCGATGANGVAGCSCHEKSKRKDQMFLKPILARRNRIEWNEEIWELAAVPQFTLPKD